MTDLSNPFPQVRPQSLNVENAAPIRRSEFAAQAKSEQIHEATKNPFMIYNPIAIAEIQKREMARKARQVAQVEKGPNGAMTDINHLPNKEHKVKRRLRAIEKAYDKLLKRLGKLLKKKKDQ